MPATETDIAPGGVRARGAGRLTQALLSTPFLGAVVAIFSWPLTWIGPQAGPDPSWVAGLYMAHGQDLEFGTQFVFTYGPLGFLEAPVLYGESLWMVAFAYRSLIYAGLAISLVWAARRAFPLPVAVAGCYALLVIGYMEEAVVLLALLWCLAALDDRRPRFAIPLVVFGGGAVGAIELLGKANFGIAVLGLCSLTLLGIPDRRRNLLRFAATTFAALGGLWLLSGQAPSNLPDFAANALQVIGGYSQAMSANLNDLSWQRPAAVGAMALLPAGAWLATRRDPWAKRLPTLAVVALFAFLGFKQGFVRQGWGSEFRFFALMLGGGIALAWMLPDRFAGMRSRLARLPRWLQGLPGHLPAIALTAPLAALTIATLPSPSFWGSLKPDSHIEFLREDLHAFLSADKRGGLRSEGRRSMRSLYRIDGRTLRTVGRRPVAVAPWEIGVAWAYGLNWRPLPVIQGYSAYTPALDRLNADALSGPGGPALILRQNPEPFAGSMDVSIDDHYGAWDPPAATLAMLCNYRAVRTTRRWQVLQRVSDRCRPPRPIGTVHARTGEEIHVPAPPNRQDIVFARIGGVGVEGWETLRSALYRARQRTVTVNGRTTWRLVPGTAQDGLIMRTPRRTDYPRPFRLAPDARTISVQIAGASPRSVEVRFFAQWVRPAASRPSASLLDRTALSSRSRTTGLARPARTRAEQPR